MIRVAALLDTAIVSGPGRQLAALANDLNSGAAQLTIILIDRPGQPPSPYRTFLEKSGVRHRTIRQRSRFDLGLVRELRRTMEDLGTDLLQTHGYKPTTLAYLNRRLGSELPWIAFFHGTTNEDRKVRVYHWLDRRLMNGADRIVAVSRRQAEGFAGARPPVELVYNAVIPGRTSPGAPPASLPERRPGITRLAVIARLSHEKGVDVLIAACGELDRRGLPFDVVVAGDGPARPALEAQIHDLGLQHRIHLLGQLDEVRHVYSQADLVVIPSRSEGLPNVLLEALAADLPVVATAVGGIPEVLDRPDAGRLVPSEDPGALADAIENAIRNNLDRDGRQARAATASRFDLEQRARRHLELYNEVLAAAPGSRTPAHA